MKLGKFDCATGLLNILYTNGDLIVRNSNMQDTNQLTITANISIKR